MQPGETISPRGVVVVEPPLDRRARRPADLVRLMISLLVLALPLIAANYALRTTGGLEQDLVKSTTGLPKLALTVVTFAAGVGVLALPVGLSLDLILRRRVWQLLDAFVAAMVGGLVAFGLRTWIVHAEPGRLLNVLTRDRLLATGQLVKGGYGFVVGWDLHNNAASARFVKFYDKATAPTVGTDAPKLTIQLGAGQHVQSWTDEGLKFVAGIGIGGTNLVADNDATAPSANDLVVNVFYR